MDPSEFEGTIERENEVVSAGVLENLLTTADLPKFQCLDLLKETQDIYLAIYNLQDTLKQKEKLNPLQNESILQEVEETSAKVIELKEEYLTRRQHLKQEVKEYLTHLPHHHPNENDELQTSFSSFLIFSEKSEKIVTGFKQEYDFLVNLNKFIEMNYFKFIKLFQDFPNYHEIIDNSLRICLKSQEVIKNAQEQLNIAEKIIHSYSPSTTSTNTEGGGAGGGGGGNNLPSISKILHYIANYEKSSSHHAHLHHFDFSSRDHSTHNPASHTSEGNNTTKNNVNNNQQELHEYYQLEINSLQQKHELELKQQLHRQFLQAQEKELQLTKQLETIINQKEDEIQQYVSMINSYELKQQLLKEQEKMIEQEKEKKANIEEKCRQQILEMSDLRDQLMKGRRDHNDLQQQYNELLNSSQQNTIQLQEKVKELEKHVSEQNSQIQNYQHLVQLLPKEEEIQQFAKEVGYYEDNDDDHTDEDKDLEEDFDEGTVERRRESDRGKLNVMSLVNGQVPPRLTWHQLEIFIQSTIRRLNNAVIAYRIKDNEWTKKYQALDVQHQQLMKTSENFQIQIKLLENEVKFSQPSSSLPFSLPSPVDRNSKNSSSKLPNSSFVDLELNNLIESSSSYPQHTIQGNQSHANSRKSTGNENCEEYVSILQQQRNHYMKQTEQFQQELQLYKNHVSRLEDEKEHLTNENMELYRRLRVLRVMNNSTHTAGSSSLSNNHEMRSRRHDQYYEDNSGGVASSGGRGSGGDQMDIIDQKYHQMYENNDLNPYKIIELEKKQYVASMSLFERAIITIYHFIMKDANLRVVFLIYLLFIHFLSFSYIFQILNPQLAEEVDMHMKNKWSMETLSMAEHPDLMD